jgi:16S rRNA (cytidine1402-2'-O)-methyltransferase
VRPSPPPTLSPCSPEAAPRGEVVVVVGGAPAPDPAAAAPDDADLRARLGALVAAGASRRDAVRQVADETGLPKRRLYDLATGAG